jgi:hypothetical protein
LSHYDYTTSLIVALKGVVMLHFRFKPKAILVFGALIAAGGIAVIELSPAASGEVRPLLQTLGIISCSSVNPCQEGNNSSSGPGLEGISAKGKGVVGQTNFNSTSPFNGQTGVRGIDHSSSGIFDTGVSGSSKKGTGVIGISTSGIGIVSESTSGIGLKSISSTNEAIFAQNTLSGAAIFAQATNGSAISASTSRGFALSSISGNGVGAFIEGTSGALVTVTPAGTGIYSIEASDGSRDVFTVNGDGNVISGASSGIGIDASTASGTGAFLHSGNGYGAEIAGTTYGVVGFAPAGSGGDPFVAEDTSDNILFYVDGSGNVFYHGTLNQFTPTRRGERAIAFGSSSTTPTLEDVGMAQLVNGQSFVQLDATFARSIDLRAPYHVFLTPDGDTRGLYVASKSPDGFLVRETQNGRDTLAFDYRIVATSLGHAGERMAPITPAQAMTIPRAPLLRSVLPTPRSHIVKPH